MCYDHIAKVLCTQCRTFIRDESVRTESCREACGRHAPITSEARVLGCCRECLAGEEEGRVTTEEDGSTGQAGQ